MVWRKATLLSGLLFLGAELWADKETGGWWAFEPLRRPEPPAASWSKDGGTDWARNPIDRFILERLQAAGLGPAPEAEKHVLVRRATFDLTGLPPAPEEMDPFLADGAPGDYERLIERLLASPRYGEHWARHWLDAARYADSNGYERDGEKKHAWKYRDYVIRSLNEDKPYDRFIREQIAGDELEVVTPETRIATGFHRLGPWDDEPADPVQDRYDQLDGMIQTTCRVFLGLTVDCARCHDHKFDPIPQKDYYRLLAFLTPSKPENDFALVPDDEKASHDEAVRRIEEEVKSLKKRTAALAASARARLPEERRKEAKPEEVAAALTEVERALRQAWEEHIAELEASRPKPYETALGLTDAGPAAPPTKILVRGDAHVPGEEVEPGFLSCLGAGGPAAIPPAGPWAKSTGRRRALAGWIAAGENPLTARVLANRVWQWHFGRGIVATPSDFGRMGERPTHPELLDWLAAEFVGSGWSLKHLHRLIMTSSTYRSSSAWRDDAGARDPENKLCWRFPVRRLEAEAIRDAILAASGRLRDEFGGPPVFPEVDRAVLAGQSRPGEGWQATDEEKASRRSVYVFVKRSVILPFLQVMDFADTGQTCPNRNVSTIAPQALTFLNSKFTNRQAEHFARRLIGECGAPAAGASDWGKYIERGYRLALSRPPAEEEVLEISRYLDRALDRLKSREKALESFCLLVYNLSEFIYLD